MSTTGAKRELFFQYSVSSTQHKECEPFVWVFRIAVTVALYRTHNLCEL